MPDERPPKPYPTFPMFAHAKGYWCKKIDRRQESFGKWAWPDRALYERSWRDAIERYNRFMESRAVGNAAAARPERMTVEYLVDAFLTHQEDRALRGQIKSKTFCQCRDACRAFREAVGRRTTIEELERQPGLVTDFMRGLEDRYGYFQFNKHVANVSGMFIWAEHPLTGVLGRPFRLRPLLKPKEEIERKREKRRREAVIGKQRWTVDELGAMLAVARNPLRAWIGLAYFAAFGNSDCADVPATAVELEPAGEHGLPDGWALVDWYRPKTEMERAAVLPPPVAADLRACAALRPEPADRAYAGLLFLTRSRGATGGLPLVRSVVHKTSVPDPGGGGGAAAEQIDRTVDIDGVGQEFRKLRDAMARCAEHGWFVNAGNAGLGRGRRSDLADAGDARRAQRRPRAPERCPACGARTTPMRRLGFYTFRHTACTYAAGATGDTARDLFEGRVIQGSRRHYVEESEVHDLFQIAQRLLRKCEQFDTPVASVLPARPAAAAAAVTRSVARRSAGAAAATRG